MQEIADQRGYELSGREAADMCAIPPSTWSRHMRDFPGRHVVSKRTQQKLATGLGINEDELAQAAIEAARRVIDLNDYTLTQLFTAWTKADVPEDEKFDQIRRVMDLADERLKRLGDEGPPVGTDERKTR